MAQKKKSEGFGSSFSIHQHYMDVINCIPDIVYWIDKDCNLKGCNHSFIQWLGIKNPKELSGTPYQQMEKTKKWDKSRIDHFKLDDMRALFSKQSQYDTEEKPVYNGKAEPDYFSSRRVVLLDKDKEVQGLVVILRDISHEKKLKEALSASKPVHAEKTQNNHQDIVEEPNVLMVEDNEIARKIEEELLTSLHCHVDVAETGDKAVKLFNPGKYDIVFMDIGLEDTSGYMVAKKLRQMEEKTGYHVPIIALTSFQADVVKYDCKDYFMDGVLTKPLTSQQAEQIIKHFINHEDVLVTGLKKVE